MTEFKGGDRVRYAGEGVVAETGKDGLWFDLPNGHRLYALYENVELLGPVEPSLGSVVSDRSGDVWQRYGRGWFMAGDSEPESWEHLYRKWAPLTVLREGRDQ